MATPLLSASLGLAVALSTLNGVDAHGSVKVPATESLPGKSAEGWVTILSPAWPWEGAGSWKGGDQAGQFAKLSKKNGFATLRSFIEDKGAPCGFSNPDVSPKPIPADGNVVFTHHNAGFTHQGPCEIWIDNKMVLHNDNCEKAYTGKGIAKSIMPTDFSSCEGKCMLRFFWLGFQNEQWQVYKNCIPIVASGASKSPPASASKTSIAPLATPKPASAPTSAPKATAAPKTTTAPTSMTKTKCQLRKPTA